MRIPNPESGELGRYDAECEELCKRTEAIATAVIVIGGKKGSGFSLSTADPEFLQVIATVLQDAARQIKEASASAHDG